MQPVSYLVLSLLLFLCSCQAPAARVRGVDDYLTREATTAPLGELLEVAAGQRMLVSAGLRKLPTWELASPIRASIQVNSWLTVDAVISGSSLVLEYQTDGYLYFSAAPGDIVLRVEGDRRPCSSAGIRESKATGELEIFVDLFDWLQKSRRRWVFAPLEAALKEEPVRGYSEVPDLATWEAVYYGGFYDGKLHLEVEMPGDDEPLRRRLFEFDLDRSRLPEEVAFREYRMEVVSVSNSRLGFRWLGY